MLLISADAFEPAHALSEFKERVAGAGAIVTFSGAVRADANNQSVHQLFLQDYPPLTAAGVSEAMARAEKHWPLLGLSVRHRIGAINVGETIVFVAAASRHRRAAFEAADFLMDFLKTEAMFWKKEISDQGEAWIEPRNDDYADRERWNHIAH